jgi:hypothetical protein
MSQFVAILSAVMLPIVELSFRSIVCCKSNVCCKSCELDLKVSTSFSSKTQLYKSNIFYELQKFIV